MGCSHIIIESRGLRLRFDGWSHELLGMFMNYHELLGVAAIANYWHVFDSYDSNAVR